MSINEDEIHFKETFGNSPTGQKTLKHIYNICGYNQGIIVLDNDRKVDPVASLYNEGRRSVWREIRKLLEPNILSITEQEEDNE